MASKYAQRPRAPSPPRSPTFGRPSDTFDFFRPKPGSGIIEKQLPPLPNRLSSVQTRKTSDNYDTDNTYSVVLDDQTVEFHPQKNGQAKMGRMFGDSEAENEETKIFNRRGNNIPKGSLSSNASSSTSSRRGGSLSSLYQARKSGMANYDSATVEQIKAQFQAQIASMLQSQERNNNINKSTQASGLNPVKNGHIPSAAERELNGIRDLQRGKSFVEARTAVQKQIERMFSSATATSTTIGNEKPNHDLSTIGLQRQNLNDRDMLKGSPVRGSNVVSSLMANPHNGSKLQSARIQHTMHGVSHALPGDELDIEPPPPTHYGIDQALRNGSVALNSYRQPSHQENVKNFFSNEDLRNIGRPDQTSMNMSKNIGAKRLTQSQDSLRFADNNDDAVIPSPFLVKDNIQKKVERQQHLGNIDIANSASQMSRSTDAESPASAKTGISSFPSSRSSPASPPQRNATAASSSSQTHKLDARVQNNVPGALKKQYVRHKVDYLGALPITSSKSTNLSALQKPLKDLYFKWRALRNLGQTNLPGTLEINDTGLTVQYIRELHKGVQEIFNPFPTIAVWAAVKFVHRRDLVQGDPHQGSRGGGNFVLHRYAFLPLISDPEGNDKSRLYHELEGEHEVELAADSPHPPLFACVMRRAGGQKILECHGFVCSSSEDAIIIAANLYQALLETMKKQKSQKSDSVRRERRRDDSLRSNNDHSSIQTSSLFSDSDATTNTNAPIRPPRRKKGSRGADGSSIGSGMLQRRRSMRSSIRSNRSNRSTKSNARRRAGAATTNSIGFVPEHPFRRSNTRLGRSDSGRKSDFSRRGSRRIARPDTTQSPPGASLGFAPPGSSMKGDVYTRVAIPRSKSFMNVSSQYNLQELFRELKEKEGVESIDDVLKKIISPNGISFNEIKPVYRELLLKLAMTMSQDEIFQRSKNIIQQEKKKQKNKKQPKQKQKGKKSYATSASEQSTLSSFLRLTFSSSKSQSQQTLDKPSGTTDVGKKAQTGSEGTTKSSSGKTLTKADISSPIPLPNGGSLPTPTGLQVTPSKTPLMVRSKKIEAASKPLPARPSSDEFEDDAYVSCSECGYESVCNYDGCSCGPKHQTHPPPIPTPTTKIIKNMKSGHKIEDCDSVCDCDGDSCASSEKCYCSLRGLPRQKMAAKLRSLPPSKLMTIHSDDGGETSSCCSGHSGCSKLSPANNSPCDIVSTDSGTDTTCQHISHKALVNPYRSHNQRDASLSRVESPQTAWRRNSSVTSYQPQRPESCISSEYSDALPHSQIGISSASVISSGSSSINSCRICQINHVKHHCCLSDDEGHSSPVSCELHRKNSGGSGYQSNDSNSPPLSSPNHSHHQRHSQMHHTRIKSLSQDNLTHLNSGSIRSGCSCSSGCSGSIASRGSLQRQHHHGRPRLSLAKSSSHLLMDIDTPLPISHPKRSLSQQKVLLVQAVDRSGKIVYRGSSNSNLNEIEVAPSPVIKPEVRSSSNLLVGPSTSHSDSSNVMSMKKSAEIAAVFSGAKINQTTNIVDHYAEEPTVQRQQHSFSEANMHSSLGYFP